MTLNDLDDFVIGGSTDNTDVPEAAIDADGKVSKQAKKEDKADRKAGIQQTYTVIADSLEFEDGYIPPKEMKPFSDYNDITQLRKDILYRIYASKYYFDGYEPNDPLLIAKGKRPDREPRYNYFTAEFLGAGTADGQLALIDALKQPVEYYISSASQIAHKVENPVDSLFIKCYSQLFGCNLFVKIYQFSNEYFIVELHEFIERENEGGNENV